MKKFLTIAIATLSMASAFILPAVAMPSEDVISINCQSAQYVLSQIEKTDAALRINRGRVYNEAINLLYAMNSRLSANKVSSPKLVEITSQFDDELTRFRELYNEYDDKLTSLIDMKCQEKPSDFYTQLEVVRESRNQLNDSAKTLDNLLNNYQTEFNDNVRPMLWKTN